jgi:hypothetical protein
VDLRRAGERPWDGAEEGDRCSGKGLPAAWAARDLLLSPAAFSRWSDKGLGSGQRVKWAVAWSQRGRDDLESIWAQGERGSAGGSKKMTRGGKIFFSLLGAN